MNDESTTRATPIDPALPRALADLSHIVHNASNLVLGHVSAIRRSPGQDPKLSDRALVVETALRRITDVVDALRASVDAAYWSPPEPRSLLDVVEDAFRLAGSEAERRAIQLVNHIDQPMGEDPTVPDSARSSFMIAALLGAGIERIGGGGSLAVTRGTAPSGLVRLEVELYRHDGLGLHRPPEPSVWLWIAERIGHEVGATIEATSAPGLEVVLLPVSSGSRRC